MNIYSVVIGCSVFLQTISAVLAMRLLTQPGRRMIGLVILAGISLMAFRRVISLWHVLTSNTSRTDMPAEIIAMVISLLFLISIIYVARLIKNQEKAVETMRESQKFLETIIETAPT